VVTKVWFGNDDLEDRLVPIENVVLLPGNPRQGDIGAISQSLERFGQQKPIVVDEAGVILAGNHTYEAARALGWTDIAVTASLLEGAEKSAFALADNHLSDLATYDDELLFDMTLEVREETGTLDGIGFNDEDLEALRLELETDPHQGDERYTPEWVFKGMNCEFDVDLAAPPGGIDYIPVDHFYTMDDDALTKDWTGEFAWCNPPYSIGAQFGQKWTTEITEGVWLGPQTNSSYRVELMRRASGVWLPDHLEFVQGWNDKSGMIRYPTLFAGFGKKGRQALINLDKAEPEHGVYFDAV